MRWPDEYLDRVAQQIRVARIREPLTAELKDHLLSQKADLMAAGLSEDEAERRATADMGDALLVGGALDAAHRPATRWRGLLFAALLTAFGLAVQAACGWPVTGERAASAAVALVPLGLLALTDYAFWVRRSLPVLAAWLVCAAYRLMVFGGFGGSPAFRAVFRPEVFQFVGPQVLAAALPMVTALLACRLLGRGRGALAACLAPTCAMLLLGWEYRDTGYDIAPCMLMAAVTLCVLALAVREGFFKVSGSRSLALLCSLAAGAVAFAFPRFSPQGKDGEARQLIAAVLRGAKPVGASASAASAQLGGMDYGMANYLLPGLVACMGWLPCLLLTLGMAALLAWCARRFMRLENRMGALLGTAAALTLMLQAAVYLPASFGLIGEHLCLPLLSNGFAMLAVDAALAGMMLGVLRGEALPEPVAGVRA